MAEGAKWTPGKIFLLVAGILAGLAVICCGAGWLIMGDKIMGGVAFGQNTAKYAQRLQTDFGSESVFELKQNGNEWVLAIAVKDELTPERVTEVQDGAWRALSECYGTDGFFPLTAVAVGNPGPGSKPGHGVVVNYAENSVPIDELVKRTGVNAPPLVNFLPSEAFAGNSNVKVTVKGEGEEDGGGEGK